MVLNYIIINKQKKLWIVTELFSNETATAYISTNIANYLSSMYAVAVLVLM